METLYDIALYKFNADIDTDIIKNLQGGPAKVKPTYIFAGNIWMHR